MADLFKVLTRSHEPWCPGHDNAPVARAYCRPCWAKAKRDQRRRGRGLLKRFDRWDGPGLDREIDRYRVRLRSGNRDQGSLNR